MVGVESAAQSRGTQAMLGDFNWAGHGVSLAALFGAIAGWFPSIAAMVAFLWYAIQIYESHTYQTALNNFLQRRRAKKLAKLVAKEKVVSAQIAALELHTAAETAKSEVTGKDN